MNHDHDSAEFPYFAFPEDALVQIHGAHGVQDFICCEVVVVGH